MEQPLTREAAKELLLSAFKSAFPAKEWPRGKLDEVLALAPFRRLQAGDTILREGQVCGSVPFVIEGSIRVFKTSSSGREITLYRIAKGQSCIISVGCGSSISSFPASVVVEETATAAFFPIEAVRRLLSESEAFRNYVLDQYSKRMADIVELVEEVAFRKVDERLAQWLSEQGSRASIISTTHQELADHVGTSREVVSRILKDWEERSFLELSRGSIRLLPRFDELLRPESDA
jgi:CRP/FNR family transcriptional regulator